MLEIPRHQCSNPGCRKVHRMLPDFVTPFKQYHQDVIEDAVDDRLDPAVTEDQPDEKTVKRWKHWLMANILNINGQLKSAAHRELGFSEELLRSGVSLLHYLRSSLQGGWLRLILPIIYNSGGRLTPVYD